MLRKKEYNEQRQKAGDTVAFWGNHWRFHMVEVKQGQGVQTRSKVSRIQRLKGLLKGLDLV